MELKLKPVKWNDLEGDKYYKIVWIDEENNVQEEGFDDLFNVFKLKFQPREFEQKGGYALKEYATYSFESIVLFDDRPGISDHKIYRTAVREIFELDHDDLLFEVIRIWFDKDHDVHEPLLLTNHCSGDEQYYRLHFKSIYDNVIQVIAFMSKFFTGTYEILPSDSLENSIMIEIPLKMRISDYPESKEISHAD